MKPTLTAALAVVNCITAAAEFICHEKNIHVHINVKDRRAARKE